MTYWSKSTNSKKFRLCLKNKVFLTNNLDHFNIYISKGYVTVEFKKNRKISSWLKLFFNFLNKMQKVSYGSENFLP